MRGCFIIPSFTAGGAERVTLSLLNGLADEENELIVINDQGILKNTTTHKSKIHIIRRNRLLTALPRIVLIIRKSQPDYIFSSLWYVNIALIALSPLLRQTKIIVREANYPSKSIALHRYAKLYALMYKYFYPKADLVISSSYAMQNEITTFCKYSGFNIMVLPNPVDEVYIRGKAQECIRPDFDGRYFISVGRLTYQKGYDRLIKIFKKIENATLYIIGDGEEKSFLIELISSLKLNDRIHLLGVQENPWKWLACADACILSSRWEGLPNVALEALSCGVNVVATPECGAILEVKNHLKDKTMLQIAPFDNSFITSLSNIKKRDKYELKKSILPDLYKKKNIFVRFEEMLEQVCR